VAGLWQGRTDRYSELRGLASTASARAAKVEMHYIGG